jgi:hypothetical protein
MDDTHNEPMTANALRSRFWCLNDVRSEKYSEFTMAFIEDFWTLTFEVNQDGSELPTTKKEN